MRRATRPPPPGFGIALPSSAHAVVPVQNKSEEEVKHQLFIHGDDSLISPIISSDFPTFAVPLHSGLHGAAAHHPHHHDHGGHVAQSSQHHQAKFIHVNSTNIYVLVDGVSLFSDEHAAQTDRSGPKLPDPTSPLPLLVPDDIVSKSGNQAAPMRRQILMDLSTTSSSSQQFPSFNSSEVLADEGTTLEQALSEVVLRQEETTQAVHDHTRYQDPYQSEPKHSPAHVHSSSSALSHAGTHIASRPQKAPVIPNETLPLSTYAIKREMKAKQQHPSASGQHCTSMPSSSVSPFSTPLRRSVSQSDLEGMEILSKIGGGQQGSVHVVQLRDGTKCALKKMDIGEATASTNDVERQGKKAGIVRELNMVKSLREHPNCPHLVAMYNATCNISEDRKELCILMELMSISVESLQKMAGRMPHNEITRIMQKSFTKNLHNNNATAARQKFFTGVEHSSMNQMVERQTPCPEVILSLIAHDVLRGLREMHEAHGRAHCDLKPANILLSENKRIFKIGDFGCAMKLVNGVISQRGVGLGSKIYKAPEQLTTDFFDEKVEITYNEKVDIWALGILLLELANGCHPTKPFQSDFWNFSANLTLKKLVMPVSCSADFYSFIELCLARESKSRSSANDLLGHDFIKRYVGVSRNCLEAFVNGVQGGCDQYQRKAQLETIRQSVVTATRTLDQEKYKRASQTKWKGFTKFLLPNVNAPAPTDPNAFPPLGS